MVVYSIDRNVYEIDKISYEKYLYDCFREDVCVSKKNLGYIMKENLTKRCRQCLILYYSGNKKICEIADILHISPATVSRDIRKAKSILIDKLDLK